VAHNFGGRDAEDQAMADMMLHDTYIVWNWGLGLIFPLVVIVLILSAAALIKYLFFR
jgi:hypothetical protein